MNLNGGLLAIHVSIRVWYVDGVDSGRDLCPFGVRAAGDDLDDGRRYLAGNDRARNHAYDAVITDG